MVKRFIASVVCLTFICSNLQYLHAQDFSIDQLPIPGTMVGVSSPFAPLSLKGIIVNPQKPLEFQFIVDTGRGPQDTASIKEEANQLVKYFLAGLTIPENDLWVNLSPYEKDRMVPEALGQTNLGRDLLAQDYILKQLTASPFVSMRTAASGHSRTASASAGLITASASLIRDCGKQKSMERLSCLRTRNARRPIASKSLWSSAWRRPGPVMDL